MNELDLIELNFSPDNLFLLNISLGIVMFGVALNLSLKDFKLLFKEKTSPILGIVSQFLLFPLLTLLLVYLFKPQPSVALGMFMVAACPGGNVSNFMTLMAKGNVALSVSLTAFATIASLVMTPFNFTFWASLYSPTADLLQSIELSFWELLKTVAVLLILPLTLGMLFNHFFPKIVLKINKPIQRLSLLIFATLIIVAFSKNTDIFVNYISVIAFMVLVHNLLALSMGYSLGKLFKRSEKDCRTLAIETGIQNTGLGLVLVFTFFKSLGGMMLIVAWWGIWDMITGIGVSKFLGSRNKESK